MQAAPASADAAATDEAAALRPTSPLPTRLPRRRENLDVEADACGLLDGS